MQVSSYNLRVGLGGRGSPSSGSATLRLRLLSRQYKHDKDQYNIISSVGSSVVGCTMIIAERRQTARRRGRTGGSVYGLAKKGLFGDPNRGHSQTGPLFLLTDRGF